jgi:hypothetical protein
MGTRAVAPSVGALGKDELPLIRLFDHSRAPDEQAAVASLWRAPITRLQWWKDLAAT